MAITKNIIFENRYAMIAEKLWSTDQARANFRKPKYFNRLLDVWLIAGMVGYFVKEYNLEYQPVEYENIVADKKTIFIETINKNFAEINQHLQLLMVNIVDDFTDEENLKLVFLNQDQNKKIDYDQARVDIYQTYVENGLNYIDAKWLVDENPENILMSIEAFVEQYNLHDVLLDDEHEANANDILETLGF